MVEVGRNLWRSACPTLLFKQGYLEMWLRKILENRLFSLSCGRKGGKEEYLIFFNKGKLTEKECCIILAKPDNYPEIFIRQLEFASLLGFLLHQWNTYGATFFFHPLPTAHLQSKQRHDPFMLWVLQTIPDWWGKEKEVWIDPRAVSDSSV